MSAKGALHGVLVTFRRRADLGLMLQRLAEQSRRLDTLVVVDNDCDSRVKAMVGANTDAAKSVEYLAAPDNLGPAGGLALGASQILPTASEADWVMFLDDNNPPRTTDMLAEIMHFGTEMLTRDPKVAGVGLAGARFDAHTAFIVRVADHELAGPVVVDHIGGDNLPCYRVPIMRNLGFPEPRLFFGYEELEYGLRLQAAGWRLYVDGAMWKRERKAWGRIGLNARPSRKLQPPGWRDYYRTRNMVWILRNHSRHFATARFVARRVVAKPAYNLPRSPAAAWTHFVLGIRAALDAYAGRMGRTLDPQIPVPSDRGATGDLDGPRRG